MSILQITPDSFKLSNEDIYNFTTTFFPNAHPKYFSTRADECVNQLRHARSIERDHLKAIVDMFFDSAQGWSCMFEVIDTVLIVKITDYLRCRGFRVIISPKKRQKY